jgi:hypothetical protein
MLRKAAVLSLVFAGLLALAGFGLMRMPGGFVPIEDQGYFMVNVQLPNGASLERTQEVMDEINEQMLALPNVRAVATVGGYSLLNGIQGPNYGFSFVTLVPWEERPGAENSMWGLLQRAQAGLARIDEGVVFPVKTGGQVAFCHGHAHGIGEPLAQGTGGGFHAGGQPVFGVAGRPAAPLAKIFDIIQADIVSAKIQQAVKHHGRMPAGQHKPIAVYPVRIFGIVL